MSLVSVQLSSTTQSQFISIASFHIQTGELSVTSIPCHLSSNSVSDHHSAGATSAIFVNHQLQQSDVSSMTRATLLAQLDTFPNILTLLLPSNSIFNAKSCCNSIEANHQYGKKYGMQQAAVVEEIMKKKVAERGEEPAGSMHQHTGSGRSSFNHQWKHHLNEIRSQARLLEVFGALVGYIAENGVYVSTEEDDEEFDNLPETFHTAQDALSGTTVHTPHINTSACIDDKVIGLQSIRSVLCINSQHLMHMDRATFDSLSIFKVEQHPCLTMKIGAPKESLSLFNILDHTCTSMGKDLLKDWMRKPTTNLDELKMRHEAIKYFVSGDALELHNDIVQYLKSIKEANPR
eukprot:CAMPEP_0117455466 /NCGR_PEP_ID=MMETSP0759-20121206/11376_1 /TAXON_ID=63605 /ORGANISM="Percolomonas cosmopolitus, Strain WS" /LENGTH=347 /DNA_ID=CAMNT_0005248775 /DNA_START=149 /DNA_END=1193 /DNA_ORIENTATION=+